MEKFNVIHKKNNLEIISKLMNYVAKQCGCRVEYKPERGRMFFYGNADFQRYIVEETLSFFGTA